MEVRRGMDKKDTLRLSAYSAAVAADMALTRYGLTNGYDERNPLVYEAVGALGVDTATTFITVAAVLIASGTYALNKKIDGKFDSRIVGAKNLILAATFVEAAIILNNIWVLNS